MITAKVFQRIDDGCGTLQLFKLYLVSHRTKSDNAFTDDWDLDLDYAKRQSDKWHVGDVIARLEKRGWTFYELPSVTVIF